MRSEFELLFNKADWFSVEKDQQTRLRDDIASYDGNRLLNTSVNDLAEYFSEKYSIDVPELDEAAIAAEQNEAQIDVSHDSRRWIDDRSRLHYISGTRVTITVPFSGESNAFQIQPSTFNLNPPRASISGSNLLLAFEGTSLDGVEVKAQIDRALSDIKGWLQNLATNVTPFNASLHHLAKQQIDQRRSKLLNDQELVSSLGFPLKHRENAPKTYVAPEVRRKIRPAPPLASTTPYKPEPVLEIAEYDYILEIVANMAHVMERSPSAFKGMDEEDLRTHFLVQLNGQYEGGATGETFNSKGKTDILLRVQNKNIFIAECKFWRGPKCLTDTINQLLGYSSWRDTKVSIIVFNTRKNFTADIDAIVPTVESHANHKRTIGKIGESSLRFILAHNNDVNRELTLTVLAFDVPKD